MLFIALSVPVPSLLPAARVLQKIPRESRVGANCERNNFISFSQKKSFRLFEPVFSSPPRQVVCEKSIKLSPQEENFKSDKVCVRGRGAQAIRFRFSVNWKGKWFNESRSIGKINVHVYHSLGWNDWSFLSMIYARAGSELCFCEMKSCKIQWRVGGNDKVWMEPIDSTIGLLTAPKWAISLKAFNMIAILNTVRKWAAKNLRKVAEINEKSLPSRWVFVSNIIRSQTESIYIFQGRRKKFFKNQRQNLTSCWPNHFWLIATDTKSNLENWKVVAHQYFHLLR